MICPACSGPLVPFGHGYLECGECDAVFLFEAGHLVDVSYCKPLPPSVKLAEVPAAVAAFFDSHPEIAATNAMTVKRPDLFGQVHDTYQTENELNGFRATQGALL